MRLYTHLLLIALIFIVSACGGGTNKTSLTNDRKIMTSNPCPFDKISWMKVTSTYDKSKVADIAFKIGAAAEADASQIKKIASGNAQASFHDSLYKTINDVTKDSVEVSQEFF